mmetsp:Transcript_79/g.201  ORF Transcript_79/g.201 Transcript_79/m.201 type:complete len:129 (+) Transcript_79:1193-1579(+)
MRCGENMKINPPSPQRRPSPSIRYRDIYIHRTNAAPAAVIMFLLIPGWRNYLLWSQRKHHDVQHQKSEQNRNLIYIKSCRLETYPPSTIGCFNSDCSAISKENDLRGGQSKVVVISTTRFEGTTNNFF